MDSCACICCVPIPLILTAVWMTLPRLVRLNRFLYSLLRLPPEELIAPNGTRNVETTSA